MEGNSEPGKKLKRPGKRRKQPRGVETCTANILLLREEHLKCLEVISQYEEDIPDLEEEAELNRQRRAAIQNDTDKFRKVFLSEQAMDELLRSNTDYVSIIESYTDWVDYSTAVDCTLMKEKARLGAAKGRLHVKK